jgi:hypothetical protein
MPLVNLSCGTLAVNVVPVGNFELRSSRRVNVRVWASLIMLPTATGTGVVPAPDWAKAVATKKMMMGTRPGLP